jgi:iron complex transport system ATP-binding protein
VAIATALLQDAPLLLLDEPRVASRPAHQRLLLGTARRPCAPGRSFLASLHDLNLAWDLADHASSSTARAAPVAGPRDSVLTAERMSDVFEVAIESVECTARAAS